nr:MAG TPA: hypothetical protein [Caudoviricetes sp.]
MLRKIIITMVFMLGLVEINCSFAASIDPPASHPLSKPNMIVLTSAAGGDIDGSLIHFRTYIDKSSVYVEKETPFEIVLAANLISANDKGGEWHITETKHTRWMYKFEEDREMYVDRGKNNWWYLKHAYYDNNGPIFRNEETKGGEAAFATIYKRKFYGMQKVPYGLRNTMTDLFADEFYVDFF